MRDKVDFEPAGTDGGSRRAAHYGGDASREPRRVPYAVAARQLLRDTLFDAARDELQQRAGRTSRWPRSRAAGVSRQTLYKEFGGRDEFAEAFVIREGERFLDAVEHAVREHLDDPAAAVAAALEVFLVTPARTRSCGCC